MSSKTLKAVKTLVVGLMVQTLVSGLQTLAAEFPGDAERKAKMTPEELAWEKVLEQNLGTFYLPRYKEAKAKGLETAWDYVKDDPKLPRVLLIGDSISRACTMPVRHALAGKVNVHRAPANCGKTSFGLRKMDIWLGDGNWDVIVFNFGIHDRKTFSETYAVNLEKIIAKLKKTGATLIWATTTPIAPGNETYEPGSSARSNVIAAKIMKKHGIQVVDLYSFILPDLKKYQLPKDCHFKPEGYELMGRKVAEAILEALQTEPA